LSVLGFWLAVKQPEDEMGRARKLIVPVLCCLAVVGFALLFLFGAGLQRVVLFPLVMIPAALVGTGFLARAMWQLTMRRSDSPMTDNR